MSVSATNLYEVIGPKFRALVLTDYAHDAIRRAGVKAAQVRNEVVDLKPIHVNLLGTLVVADGAEYDSILMIEVEDA